MCNVDSIVNARLRRLWGESNCGDSNFFEENSDTEWTTSEHSSAILWDIIRRIRQTSSVFDNIPESAVRKFIPMIRSYPEGTVFIKEWAIDERSFYVLVRGKVSIWLDSVRILEFSGFHTFWETGFIGEPRLATVKAEEKSYVIQLGERDIESLPIEIQIIFHRNLAREIARKMRETNQWYITIAKNTTAVSVNAVLSKDFNSPDIPSREIVPKKLHRGR